MLRCVADQTPEPFAGVAEIVADGVRSLGVEAEVVVVPETALPSGGRVLVENKLKAPWDVLLFGWFDLSSEAPPAAVHREFFGRDGAFRIGPENPELDALFDEIKVQLDGERLVEVAQRHWSRTRTCVRGAGMVPWRACPAPRPRDTRSACACWP